MSTTHSIIPMQVRALSEGARGAVLDGARGAATIGFNEV